MAVWRRSRHWLVPIMLLLCVTLPHLGDGDWMRGDSAWYAAIGVQSWRTGHLWTLFEAPGREYFNKPPLVFWIQGAWMSLAGIGPWQARLPTVCAAAMCIACISGIARGLHGRRAAMFAGMLLAINVEFFRRTREISLDIWQCAFMLLSAWLMVVAIRRAGPAASRWHPWWPVLGAGLALGAALMCKPLIALAAPPLVALWMGMRAREASPRHSIARAIALAMLVLSIGIAAALPWHLSMIARHGDLFTAQYFGREIADRASGELVGGQSQTQPMWFYLASAASAWSMWLLAAVLAIGARFRWSCDRRGRELLKFALPWALGWLILLTVFPDRRDRYAIPMHAGLALAAGACIAGRSRGVSRIMRWAPLAAAAAAGVFAALPVRVQRPINPQWPALLAWLGDNAPEGTWDGSFSGAPSARIYLYTGAWPAPTRDRHGHIIQEPPPGGIILYHRRGGWSPGEGETVVWQQGDLLAARIGETGWKPAAKPDPGE